MSFTSFLRFFRKRSLSRSNAVRPPAPPRGRAWKCPRPGVCPLTRPVYIVGGHAGPEQSADHELHADHSISVLENVVANNAANPTTRPTLATTSFGQTATRSPSIRTSTIASATFNVNPPLFLISQTAGKSLPVYCTPAVSFKGDQFLKPTTPCRWPIRTSGGVNCRHDTVSKSTSASIRLRPVLATLVRFSTIRVP